MQTIHIVSPDISCDHCRQTIEREVSNVPGVQSVQVDVASKRVAVTFDPADVTEDDILGRLDEEGYPPADWSET